MYTLNHYAYCGMSMKIAEGDEQDVRQAAAKYLRGKRNQDFPIHSLNKGTRWEICEPEDVMMVPDCCGILKINFVEPDCDEDDDYFEEID